MSFDSAIPDLQQGGILTAAQATANPGTPTAGALVTLGLGEGQGACAVDLRGTFTNTSTVVFECSVDGINFVAYSVTPLAGGAAVTQATAAGQWVANCAALRQIRVRCSVYTTNDSITCTVTASTAHR